MAKNIPTVAEVTQGEVVNFVQGALAQMAAGGTNVCLALCENGVFRGTT